MNERKKVAHLLLGPAGGRLAVDTRGEREVTGLILAAEGGRASILKLLLTRKELYPLKKTT